MPQIPTSEAVSVPRVLAGLAIDYLRWTQLIPMITAWTFLLLTVGAMLLVSFQQESFSLIERGAAGYERIFGSIEPEQSAERPASETESEDRSVAAGDAAVRFSSEDFMPWVLKAWAIVALAGWLLGMLRTRIFGPREPIDLRRKLLLAAVPGISCVVLFGLAYFFGSEEFHGSTLGWMLMFTGFPFGVWLVSAYSLAVTHGLDIVRRRIVESS